MKKVLVIMAVVVFLAQTASAQTYTEENKTLGSEWKYAFSSEGRKQWSPEFTARYEMGLFTAGVAGTVGVRIDDKRTLGIIGWKGYSHMDAVPGDMYEIAGGLCFRRYFPLGRRGIFAFYSDIEAGAGYCQSISGNFSEDVRPVYEPGEFYPYLVWQPGFRIRFWKNIHIFTGLTVSYSNLGLHLGIGF